MKIETKEIYKCEFCNKLYQVKRFAEYHEKICFKNPENNRPCFSCDNLTKQDTIVFVDYPNNRNVSLFYCDAKEKYLYTPKSEIKKNYFELSEEANDPMPKKCKEYKKWAI